MYLLSFLYFEVNDKPSEFHNKFSTDYQYMNRSAILQIKIHIFNLI